MKKILLGVIASGLIVSNLSAEIETVNLRIMDEYHIDGNKCVVAGVNENFFSYFFVEKKGSKECDKLKNLNLKSEKVYKMKVNVKDVEEESCSAKFIQMVK